MALKKITPGTPKTKRQDKINRSIKSIVDHKKKERKFRDTLDYSTYLFENPLLKKNTASFLRVRKNIIKQSQLVFQHRQKKLQGVFKEINPAIISEKIIKKYPNIVSPGLRKEALNKYKKFISFSEIAGIHPEFSINFRYKVSVVEGKTRVHLFEFKNMFGLNSTNPIYKEFYKNAVNELKKNTKLKKAEFILDSKFLDSPYAEYLKSL